jgi:hypothetical protein
MWAACVAFLLAPPDGWAKQKGAQLASGSFFIELGYAPPEDAPWKSSKSTSYGRFEYKYEDTGPPGMYSTGFNLRFERSWEDRLVIETRTQVGCYENKHADGTSAVGKITGQKQAMGNPKAMGPKTRWMTGSTINSPTRYWFGVGDVRSCPSAMYRAVVEYRVFEDAEYLAKKRREAERKRREEERKRKEAERQIREEEERRRQEEARKQREERERQQRQAAANTTSSPSYGGDSSTSSSPSSGSTSTDTGSSTSTDTSGSSSTSSSGESGSEGDGSMGSTLASTAGTGVGGLAALASSGSDDDSDDPSELKEELDGIRNAGSHWGGWAITGGIALVLSGGFPLMFYGMNNTSLRRLKSRCSDGDAGACRERKRHLQDISARPESSFWLGPEGAGSWWAPFTMQFTQGLAYNHYNGDLLYQPGADTESHASGLPERPIAHIEGPLTGSSVGMALRLGIFRVRGAYKYQIGNLLGRNGEALRRNIVSDQEPICPEGGTDSCSRIVVERQQSLHSIDVAYGIQFFQGFFSPYVEHGFRFFLGDHDSAVGYHDEYYVNGGFDGRLELDNSHYLRLGNVFSFSTAASDGPIRRAFIIDAGYSMGLSGSMPRGADVLLGYSVFFE